MAWNTPFGLIPRPQTDLNSRILSRRQSSSDPHRRGPRRADLRGAHLRTANLTRTFLREAEDGIERLVYTEPCWSMQNGNDLIRRRTKMLMRRRTALIRICAAFGSLAATTSAATLYTQVNGFTTDTIVGPHSCTNVGTNTAGCNPGG